MRVSTYKGSINVDLKPDTGAEEILQKATSALQRLPSPEEVFPWSDQECSKQILQWSDRECSDFLKKGSPLWAELGPVVFALSTYIPRAAQNLWDDLTDTSYEDEADKHDSLWVFLDKHKKADAAFSKIYVWELLLCVQDVLDSVTPNWWRH